MINTRFTRSRTIPSITWLTGHLLQELIQHINTVKPRPGINDTCLLSLQVSQPKSNSNNPILLKSFSIHRRIPMNCRGDVQAFPHLTAEKISWAYFTKLKMTANVIHGCILLNCRYYQECILSSRSHSNKHVLYTKSFNIYASIYWPTSKTILLFIFLVCSKPCYFFH